LSKKKKNKIDKNKKVKYYQPTKRDIKKYIPKGISPPDNKKQQKTREDVKDGEYLITYTRHLEKRLRNLETEKQLIDAERVRLEQEVHSLRNEVDRLINARLRKSPRVSNNSRNNFSEILGKDDKKQKESPTDSRAKIDSPIEKEVDKLQEPSGRLLKWYELQGIIAEQPPASKNKMKKEEKNKSDYAFKIIVLGKPEKTAFIRRFISGIFQEDIKMTIGADFSVKNVEVDGKTVILRIWDFAGEDRFRILLPAFAKGADGAIVMYDIIDANVISEVIELVKKDVGNIPIFLNVPKLPSKAKEIVSLTKKYTFTDISTEIGSRVESVFELLTKKILNMDILENNN